MPNDPNEPLPTTPVGPAPDAPPQPQPPQAQAAPPEASRWGPPPPPGWGGPPSWGPPPYVPPPPPPRRDRLALGVVAFIFGGLFLVFFGFLLLAYGAVRGESPGLATGPQIGVVRVKGEIGAGPGAVDAETVEKALKKFADDSAVKAIVVRIDSPGGAVGPSQEIYDEIRKAGAKKPVVCSMGSVAASGGFYLAMGCRKIVAEPGTLTGSIGVVMELANVKGLADRFGFKMDVVKSGALKDTGNPFRDMTPEDRAYLQSLIDRAYAQFLGAVSAGRNIPAEKIRPIADGRVLTGDEAKQRGLIDALGNFYDAVDVAKREAKVSGEPRLVYPPEDRAHFFEQLVGDAASAVSDAVRAGVHQETARARAPGLYFLSR